MAFRRKQLAKMAMSKAKRFSLWLSLILGAGISSVGLLPEPEVFLAGVLVIGLLVAATVHYRLWRWVPLKATQVRPPGLGMGCLMAVTAALLLRGHEWSCVVIPLLSAFVTIAMFYGLTRYGRFVDSDGSELT